MYQISTYILTKRQIIYPSIKNDLLVIGIRIEVLIQSLVTLIQQWSNAKQVVAKHNSVEIWCENMGLRGISLVLKGALDLGNTIEC